MRHLGSFLLFTALAVGAVTANILGLAVGWDLIMGSHHEWPTYVWVSGLLGLCTLPCTVLLTLHDRRHRTEEERGLEGLRLLTEG